MLRTSPEELYDALPRPLSRLNGSGREEGTWEEERWGRQGIGKNLSVY